MLSIRPEQPTDMADIFRINRAAFGREEEARLVDALRDAGALTCSLVAVMDEQIVGHIAFSPVTIEPKNPGVALAGLTPMAVHPDQQRSGIGTRLLEAGLDECRKTGIDLVVVLGHPDYYPRFGFVPSSAYGITCEYEVPEEVFMALPLKPITGLSGTIHYHPAFNQV